MQELFYIEENETDEDKVLSGVWVDYGVAEFKIASFESPKYTKALSKIRRLTGFLDENGSVKKGKVFKAQHVNAFNADPHYANKITLRAMAESILLDWKGLALNRESGETPYSKGLAFDLLDKNSRISEFVASVAYDENGEFYDFLTETEKEALGNEQKNITSTRSSIVSGSKKQVIK